MTSPSPAIPATPASVGTDQSVDVDVIARAERIRAIDRKVGRVAWRLFKWASVFLLVIVPFATIVLVPHGFMRFPCRSKQSEAKGNLKALYVAEESYRAEFGSYITDPRALGWTPKGARIRYEYLVKVSGSEAPNDTPPQFEAYAVGVDEEVSGDVWRIDHDNTFGNVMNGCVR